MNCTKGFEEIFNKLTGLQEIIQKLGRNANG
jgi:hypothetical protein